MKNNHPFHLVDFSPWPYILSCGILSTILGLVMYLHFSYLSLFFSGLVIIIMSLFCWFSDIISEATFQGSHSEKVQQGLQMGMILFIVSEVCFFGSFFWAFFHSSLSPSIDIGCQWPPSGVNPLNPFSLPTTNTLLLLGSGATITWAHHSMVNNNSKDTMFSLFLTLFLGTAFTVLQGLEYHWSSFTMSEGIYGSTFFIATGFHGLHVMMGTMFISVTYFSVMDFQFSSKHHFGFEASAWYWHFVDVVWLFLFISIYWWGSKCTF